MKRPDIIRSITDYLIAVRGEYELTYHEAIDLCDYIDELEEQLRNAEQDIDTLTLERKNLLHKLQRSEGSESSPTLDDHDVLASSSHPQTPEGSSSVHSPSGEIAIGDRVRSTNPRFPFGGVVKRISEPNHNGDVIYGFDDAQGTAYGLWSFEAEKVSEGSDTFVTAGQIAPASDPLEFADGYKNGVLAARIEMRDREDQKHSGESPAAYLYATDPFDKVLIDIVNTNRRKRKDYANDGDAFSNFRTSSSLLGLDGFGPTESALFNVGQKLARLKSLRENGRMEDTANEAVADTYLDLAVYAVIAYAIYKDGNK